MANYFEMTRDELAAEKAALEEEYKKFQAMGLKLNMARGKPGPHQMDLAMGLLQMNDYTTDAGTDARNYGDLEGLHCLLSTSCQGDLCAGLPRDGCCHRGAVSD